MSYTPAVTPPGGLRPAAFQGTFAQAIVTDFDIYSPQELVGLFARHNQDISMMLMLKNMGFSSPLQGPVAGHWEEDWKIDNIVVDSFTGGATPGATAVITLDASCIYTQTIAGSPQSFSYPRVGDVIEFPDRNQCIIQSKSNDQTQITVKPRKGTQTLADSIEAGATYFLPTNAWGEGTAQPKGRVERVIKYTNKPQIVKEHVGSTGSELTNKAYFEPIPGKPGSFYLLGAYNTEYRFTVATDGALIFGRDNDQWTQTSDALGFTVNVNTTEGLIDFGVTSGYTEEYLAGAYILQDFNDVGKIYNRERPSGRDIAVWQGYDIFLEVEDTLVDYLKETMVDYTMNKYFAGVDTYGESASDFAVNIGFNALSKGGYNFIFKKLEVFNHPKYAGSTGYSYPGWQIFTPMSFVTNKQNNTTMPTVGYQYKALDGYNREVEVWKLGGAGPIQKTDGIDAMSCEYRGEFTFHGACANQIVINKPA